MAEKSLDVVIQSVLYGGERSDLFRAFEAAANSAEQAVKDGHVVVWKLFIGDCSPEPVLTSDDIENATKLVSDFGGSFEYIFFGENLGSALGHNTLASRENSSYLVILNPDAIMSPDALGRLIRRMEPHVGSVEARQIPLEHPKDYDEITGETMWSSTACLITRRTIFDEVGGFDHETFFLYCDDVDYSWQLRLAGYSVVYEPAATVFHDKRLSLDGGWQASPSEIYYSAEAALLLAHKYSRPDLVAKNLREFARSKSEPHIRAGREFKRKERENVLCSPCDSDNVVAYFEGGTYAPHRF